MGKKRKYEVDVDSERSMYSSFAAAANAVSAMYTEGVRQSRAGRTAGQRAMLDKVVSFVGQYPNDAIPRMALLQWLHTEWQSVDAQEVAVTQPPLQYMPPVMAAASTPGGTDPGLAGEQAAPLSSSKPPRAYHHYHATSMPSPGRRSTASMVTDDMEEAQQQQQQQVPLPAFGFVSTPAGAFYAPAQPPQ